MSFFSVLRSYITSLVLLTAIAIPVNAKLISNAVRCLGLLVVLMAGAGPARASIIMTGNVNVAGTYPGPLYVWGRLIVGDSGDGALNVAAGSMLFNSDTGFIGYYSGSTGVATVTGFGSQWNNSQNLIVGFYGDGILNVEAGASSPIRLVCLVAIPAQQAR